MATDMGFCLLGPLAVRRGQAAVPLPRGKQRVILAMLLLNANRIVRVTELAEMLWDAEPPPSGTVAVQNYVMRLRQTLADAGRARIITQPHGYLIRVEAGELDVSRFEALLAAARAAARDRSWDRAAGHAEAALRLWRGEPLADVDSETLRTREVPRLEELRLQALEVRIDADLRLGRHADVIAESRQLAGAYPLREHLHGLLMTALYRDGRQAEALAAYQRARQALVAHLGTEPGTALRELHRQILAADPALDFSATEGLRSAVPRLLPAAVRHFTGRARELAELSGTLDQTGPGTVVITAIGGTAGVGKTALAVQWAHTVAGRFPDGQLYVNLRGYDPDQPLAAAEALAGFLRALGVPGPEIPDELEDRARLYRSGLAGRRVLVLVDNARDSEQVRPLLPGDPGCVAVVTSRDTLAGLVAVDGARRLDLDALPLDDAVGLLRSLIGLRSDDEPQAVAELAELCARLPLALRIAAEVAAGFPSVVLADMVAELTAGKLDFLDAGEDRADVRAVFSWSFRQLPDDAAGAFAVIGLHPGQDLDVYAAAALTGTTAGQARRVLRRLHRASLLQAAGPGRYGMHDLLRAYAREQAAARDTGGQCQQALTGLFDYYLATAAAAIDILYPAEAHYRPRISPADAVVPEMSGEAEARAWLDAERADLVAVVVHCATHGWPGHATGLAGTLFRYLITGSYLPEADMIYRHALHAARLSADLAAEAAALHGVGGISFIKGHFRDAAGHSRAALECYRRCGDRKGEARVLRNLGMTELQLHSHQTAVDYYQQAIAACEDAGDSLGAARTLADLAYTETELDRYDQAAEHLQRALPVLREAGDQIYEAGTLSRIGDLGLRRGELTQAAGFFEQSLDVFRRIGSPAGVAHALCGLGEVSLRRGEYKEAIGYLRQALTLFRETGEQHAETKTLRRLAEALRGAGQHAAAHAELTAALRLATETGNTYQQASVHRDLAETHHRTGEGEQARRHWQQALTLYTQLGAPEADQVRSQLNAYG